MLGHEGTQHQPATLADRFARVDAQITDLRRELVQRERPRQGARRRMSRRTVGLLAATIVVATVALLSTIGTRLGARPSDTAQPGGSKPSPELTKPPAQAGAPGPASTPAQTSAPPPPAAASESQPAQVATPPPPATPTPPAATPTPRPAPTIGPRTIIDERFADTPRNWPNNPQSTAWFADGAYRLLARQPGQFVALGAPLEAQCGTLS